MSKSLVSSSFVVAACLAACQEIPSNAVTAVADEAPPTAFLTAELCARCHSQSPNASALTDATGNDVSPHGTWRATTMANAFRDPYWRAQVAREVELATATGNAGAERAIETFCARCHAPSAVHDAVLFERDVPSLDQLEHDAIAREGVTCTVCHQAQPDGLGHEDSFDGRLVIRDEDVLFGPYPDPAVGPMRMHTRKTPTHGPHVQRSALCGSCHTLRTAHAPNAPAFVEQSPYLEWRNSAFSDEDGERESARSCQACHMPDVGSLRIARMPSGADFNVAVRDEVRAHSFVGGNAFLLDLLRANAERLGITVPAAAFERAAAATRANLAHATARVAIENVSRAGRALSFDVRVENLTGHKLPTGYPSRRAWLAVDVTHSGERVFSSGLFDERGRLVGPADELALPHFERIERSDQVQVYESVALDARGNVTTTLSSMATRAKDSRLLPRGWRADGPHAEETRPVGVEDDDFVAGGDVVTYACTLPESARGELRVVVNFVYQPIPPAWAEALRTSAAPEAQSFVEMYDAADPTPETLAVAVELVPAE
ncbi:MAG: hypothetical protein L6Q99_19120 [Planctomycetes bacterium]|nr:hypothetical protein [Planctomycetota bacterium]